MQAQGGALPETPLDPDQSLELLAEVALAYQQHGDHPRYFARVPGPCSFAVVLGECMGTGFNTISASWGGGSGPATIELVVIEWLRQMIGMPEGTEGVLLSAFNSWVKKPQKRVFLTKQSASTLCAWSMRIECLIGNKTGKTRRQLTDRFTAYFRDSIRELLARRSRSSAQSAPSEYPEDTR